MRTWGLRQFFKDLVLKKRILKKRPHIPRSHPGVRVSHSRMWREVDPPPSIAHWGNYVLNTSLSCVLSEEKSLPLVDSVINIEELKIIYFPSTIFPLFTRAKSLRARKCWFPSLEMKAIIINFFKTNSIFNGTQYTVRWNFREISLMVF